MTSALILAATVVSALTVSAATPGAMPDWSKAATAQRAVYNEPFVIDGLQAAISRVSYVSQYPDGTLPDTGARAVQVEFWARNPEKNDITFFDRFYPYAVVSDGSDTDGEGVSFYPLESNAGIGDLKLAPGMNLHARFVLEIPANTTVTGLVIYGPTDGAKVTLSPGAFAPVAPMSVP
ncbi:MAG: hypothetical protein DLM53_11985 [Candidatus Eremiobacter antarcticus]|nr:hypothetical protein [Candidatus Eremiobacteraeota bacterium]MBC5808944.1 hypothetical protein [Candidatus Eremiobacteraeota bacterium]PZR60376.1 MAG: hypothetical protein DLM53_11985 [Candidatus Eremiobacter sp. RRmetagenome_bin22]